MKILGNFKISHQTKVLSLRTCAYLFVASLIIGTVAYMLIEQYDFTEALYMAVITLSTVGFGEVKPLSSLGRIFTSFYVIANLAITALFISQLTQHLKEGGLIDKLRMSIMEREISELKDHVIVCGAGRYGREIIAQLEGTEEKVILIEKNEDNLQKTIEDHPNLLYIQADATHDDALEHAGIAFAKTLIVTLGDDSDNAFTVLSARQITANATGRNKKLIIIARVYHPESKPKLQRVGADYVIQPEQIGSFYMATLVRKPSAVEFFTSLAGKSSVSVGFEEIEHDKLPEKLKNRSLREMNLRSKTGVSVVALRYADGHYEVNPDPTTLIQKGTSLITLGDSEQLVRLKNLLEDVQ